MDSGVLFHALYAATTNSQRHKNNILIAINFNLSRSFFNNRPAQHTACESFICGPRELFVRNQLGTPGMAKSFLRGAQIF